MDTEGLAQAPDPSDVPVMTWRRYAVIAAVLLALPLLLSLSAPGYTYSPSVFPYGAYVSSHRVMLSGLQCWVFLWIVVSSTVAIWLYRSKGATGLQAVMHPAWAIAVFVLLIVEGRHLRPREDAQIVASIHAVYDSIPPGAPLDPIIAKLGANFSWTGLNATSMGREMNFFPIAPGRPHEFNITHNAVWEPAIAVWTDARGRVFRKALYKHDRVLALVPLLRPEEPRSFLGVLAGTPGHPTFKQCGSGQVLPVTLSAEFPAHLTLAPSERGDNAAVFGRYAQLGGERTLVLDGYSQIGRSGTYDQSIYDRCYYSPPRRG